LKNLTGYDKVEVLEAFCEATNEMFPNLREVLESQAETGKTLSGANILRSAASNDSNTGSDRREGNSNQGRASTPAASPAKSNETGDDKSFEIYEDRDVGMEDFHGQHDTNTWTAVNKHGKRGSDDGDSVQENGFADELKELKVTDNGHGKTAKTKTVSRKLQKKGSRPVLAESQGNQAYEAELMARRWSS
jgi:hypothetical protein